jgi:hypothetical protein
MYKISVFYIVNKDIFTKSTIVNSKEDLIELCLTYYNTYLAQCKINFENYIAHNKSDSFIYSTDSNFFKIFYHMIPEKVLKSLEENNDLPV